MSVWKTMTTQAKVDALKRDAGNLSATVISSMYGTSRSAVLGFGRRNGIFFAKSKSVNQPVRRKKSVWGQLSAEQRMALINAGRDLQMTLREVAKKLQCDPSVLGKFCLQRGIRFQREKTCPDMVLKRSEAMKNCWGELKTSRPVTLIDMPVRRHCRWPIGSGSGADQLFCGAPCGVEETYCEHHSTLSRPPYSRARQNHGGRPNV